MILEFQYLICFSIFVVLQSLAINGIFEASREGMVIYPFRIFLSRYISEYWMNPIFNCIRCMSSFWGAVTFFITVIPLFGFCWIELWGGALDVFILCSLNYFFYKRL